MADIEKLTEEVIINRPVVNPDTNTCLIPELDNREIIKCVIDENTNNINGIWLNPDCSSGKTKALYLYKDNKWLFGNEIARNNLISLSDRSLEDRQRLGSIGGIKAKQNRDAKKNINELAKAMLEMSLSDKQIDSVLGDSAKDILPDKSVAAVMLARMIQGACEGSFKCFETVRDTAGYKPKNEVEINADIMTDADRSLVDNLKNRLEKSG